MEQQQHLKMVNKFFFETLHKLLIER
jgi:hypothetical protein